MTRKSDKVRYSRAGDQFHYRWAARRCLALLSPNSDLVCLTLEGVSSAETENESPDTREEVVDLAEYFCSSELSDARNVIYHQLKHSYQCDDPWTLSALKKTLRGFFKRFLIWQTEASDTSKQRIEFTYTTNRPAAQSAHSLFSRIQAKSLQKEDEKQWLQIKGYLGTKNDSLAYEFLSCFRIEDLNDIHWKQRNILIQELRGYIPGGDAEAADQLWRLVVEKISPEFASNPEITREDVLRYLNTNHDELFPASSLIESGEGHFSREQENDIIETILQSDGAPIVIHAEGGVGKTALANRLVHQITNGSLAIIFDCFGNGSYRNATQRRDEHDVGLVQISNELASIGLCHPLIPSRFAKPADYLKAFAYRLEQAATILTAENPNARLVILIDAADNAQMAAEEYQERASFAKDLIRETLPKGVVPVFLCRSHRIDKLDPPSGYVDLPLRSFSEAETRTHLNSRFPDANNRDVQEFHRLSSQNPRVQATALSRNLGLQETITLLGPEPSSVEDTIRSLFENAIAKHLDSIPESEASQVEKLCQTLASVRPFVPVRILSQASGIDAGAIRSFVSDLGRPLSIIGDAIQFYDEPSETWFRETYKPQAAKMLEFVEALKPLATTDSYAASALPQLMLEAGLYDELVEQALTDADVYGDNAVDRRNASLQRLQLALKAALRKKRNGDAAKLSLKAGGETAGSDRQEALIQENTDLISHLLPAHRLREIIAQKTFSSAWHGGHHAYEACLLSGNAETLPESRSYLRLAQRWIQNWSSLPKEKRKKEEIKDADIAEIAMCVLHLVGPEAFVRELERWTPKAVAYRVSSIVLRRLIDLQEYELVDQIVDHSQENLCILLAAINQQNSIFRYPNRKSVLNALEGLKQFSRRLKKQAPGHSHEEPLLSVVNSVAQAAVAQKAAKRAAVADVMDKYIPSPERFHFSSFSDEPRFTIVRANCLRAALRNEQIELSDFAKPDVREQLKKERHSQGRQAQELTEDVGSVLPWHKLWAAALLDNIKNEELDKEIEACLEEFRSDDYGRRRDSRSITKEISRLWLEIIILVDPTIERINRLKDWKSSLRQPLFTPALTHLAHVCARTDFYDDHAFEFAQEAFDIIDQDRMDAEQKVDVYIGLSRAIYAANAHEAEHYLEKAVEVSGHIGDENLDRWSALLELSNTASSSKAPLPELSYRLARGAEVVYDFVARDKHFDWDGTVEAITRLCPSSSLAIASRWRDRSFGWMARLVPGAIDQLSETGLISPSAALAFIGFKYNWKHMELLERAIASVEDKTKEKNLFDSTARYMRIRGGAPELWERLSELAALNGWSDSDFKSLGQAALAQEKRERKRREGSHGNYKAGIDRPKNWDQIFDGLNVSSPESIQSAHHRMWEGKPPYHTELFATELFKRTPKGHECAALEATFSVSDFSLYDIRGIYESIPNGWHKRNYVRSKLREITERVCKTYYYEIAKSRYWQPLPYEIISKCSGVTEPEIFHWVVEACAENPIILGSGRLFSLVGLIAPSLTQEQAKSALEFGLDLLEHEMSEEDGDGKWGLHLQPPNEVSASCAGYIWAALGSPDSAERWEAAQSVCLLCTFGERDVLDHLRDYATGKDATPFHDASLPFYEMTARLWLLIALQRSLALGQSKSVLRFREFLNGSCDPSQRHVILRGTAAKILIGLHSCNAITVSKADLKRLSSINVSKKETVTAETYERKLTVPTSIPDAEEDKYYFAYDISRYWFESLGRIFAFGPKEIENRAYKFLRNEWDVVGQGGWNSDPRYKRGLYRERETHHSHGSYPLAEDLTFYHSYHAMMTVAGELIDTTTRYQHTYEGDKLEEWISQHFLTRQDGLWLADRRDPQPNDEPQWKSTEEQDDWRYSVQKDDLLGAVFSGKHELVVWGRWNFAESSREERVSISSALVNSETGRFLLRALQTATNPHDYKIPSSGDELEINSQSYQLKGWVWETSKEHGIDERDPWAGDIGYPPLRPARWFQEKFSLAADYEERNWLSPEFEDRSVLRSLVWGRKSDRDYHSTPETGARLLVEKDCLKSWLGSLSMNLIIEIQIGREFKRDSYRHGRDEGPDYLPSYTLMAMFDSNGKIETI